jgi:hypothetical protein
MAGQWHTPARPDIGFEAEWTMREQDLSNSMPSEELRRLRALDQQALENGSRMLFVPTFYALGRKAAGHSD